MEVSENSGLTYDSKSIAKNTVYNILGFGIPLVFAIAIIPSLIKGLGEEKFGILNLAWMVVGYFSILDFGIARALTKFIAEKNSLNQSEEIPSIFWTSFFLMIIISSVITIILIISTPLFVCEIFNISQELQTETTSTFYVLALSVPIVTISAGARGVLEAYQNFKILNIIRVILGIFSFLGPLLCLIFSKDLFWIVVILVGIRFIILILYMIQCFKLNPGLKRKLYFKTELIKPIFILSGWMSVSNIVAPIIVYLDRLLIGTLVSATAIAYYATPYEIVTKLLIIPTALAGVLFPTFSANYLNDFEFVYKLSLKTSKYIFIFMYPIVFLMINFAYEGMDLWLGKIFSDKSSLVLQLLTLSILFNSVAYIPFTFLHGIGRPDLTAKLHLLELIPYLLVMWLAIKQAGINGAAFVFLLRVLIDAAVLFYLAKKQIPSRSKFSFKIIYFLIAIACLIPFLAILINNILLKFALSSIIISCFSIMAWKYMFLEDEKIFLVSRIKNLSQKVYG